MTIEQDDTNGQLERSLIDVAVESWRFARLFSRVVSKLDAGESSRYVNQLRYFQKKVEESLEASGLKIVNVEGHPFDPGIAASALNIGDFGPDDELLVDQMVEPIIMGPEGLRKQGTVMLRRVHVLNTSELISELRTVQFAPMTESRCAFTRARIKMT